jgi:hypothetical protein
MLGETKGSHTKGIAQGATQHWVGVPAAEPGCAMSDHRQFERHRLPVREKLLADPVIWVVAVLRTRSLALLCSDWRRSVQILRDYQFWNHTNGLA